jgi:mannan endo-1,4-beta-mannosidase
VTYNVFRSTSSGFTPSPGNQIASGLNSTSLSDAGLASSTTYFYKVEAADAAGASAPSNQAAATTGAGTVFACHVVYSVVNQWNTGFQTAITIQNNGAVDITSWVLTWTFPSSQQIYGLWNGSAVQSGATVTVNNMNYNGTIPAHGSYNGVGFTANYSGSNPSPVAFSVNGTICN